MSILTENTAQVKMILADGIYPYDDPEDQFVVVIGGEEVAWTTTEAQAQRSLNEMLHYDSEHFQKCQSDYTPNPLLNVCPAVKVQPFRLQEAMPSPVSRDSSGAHVALLGAGYRRAK